MGVKFTPDQQRAIDTFDKSILVAAAAGSGKTAVLVQRIINIILEGKANVDEMLVVTFTKAAASEMRLKLAKAIKKRMHDDPANRARLREQLNLLYRAYISTFDSFAVRVIKEFFYLIDIEPDFKACDEIQSALLQRDAVDELFDEAFDNDNLIEGGSFRDFLRLYSSDRNEDEIKADLIASYAKLRSMPNYFDWAVSSIDNLKINRDEIANSDLGRTILADAAETMSEAVGLAEEIRDLYVDNGIEQKFYQMLGSEYEGLCILRDKALSGQLDEEFIETIENFDFVNLQKTTLYFGKDEVDAKKAYNEFKKEITPIRKRYRDDLFKPFCSRYFLPDFDTRIAEMNATYEYTLYYINLLRQFEAIYQKEKNASKLLDFADMEHIAVRILENEEAANALRKRFNFIFIDEYQDTNNIQEYLIGRIARENNLFRVGDVKQSIYRFRQAEPAIFEHVYEQYSAGEDNNVTAIDLNMNFRSNRRTLDYINEIFGKVMDNYDDRAKLYFGQGTWETYNPEYDFMPEVHLLYHDKDSDKGTETEENMRGDDAHGSDLSEEYDADCAVDDEILSLSKEEAEAAYIAELIESIIGSEFNDTVTGELRRAEARDVVVLMRSVKYRGEILARALHKVKVQAHIEEEENYFDAVEIGIAISLLSTIDNMKRDIPLIASLHSEIFGWRPEELAEVRIAHIRHEDELADCRIDSDSHDNRVRSGHRAAYWEALSWYADFGDDDTLREKANFAISKIKEWRELSRMMPIEDFIWKVLVDSGYYMIVGAMYSGDRRQANLRALVDRARKYSEDTIASLSTFLDFLNVMKNKNVSNGQVSMVSKDDNVVRITTIHKSKGLEYPFVIVGGLGHRFRKEGSERKLSFDSELGVALPYISPDRRYWRSTLMQRAIAVKSNNESYKEELRVLYVALTRARNKLHLVGTVDSEEKLMKKVGRPGNFMEVIKESLHTPYNEYHIRPLELSEGGSERIYVNDILSSRPEIVNPEAMKIYKEVNRRLSYKYPDEGLLGLPAKMSVSAIRMEKLKHELEGETSKAGIGAMCEFDAEGTTGNTIEAVSVDDEVIHILIDNDKRKKASAADKGIAYHRIMEFLDFTKVYGENSINPSESVTDMSALNVDKDYIRERAQFLCDNGAIDDDVFKALNLRHAVAFFESELGRRACRAAALGKLKREKAFTLRTELDGQKVLVQGVIDCCWEEAGKMILVDYKSSFINPRADHASEIARLQHEYKTQIELYSQAVETGAGCPVGEAYLYLFMSDEAVRI